MLRSMVEFFCVPAFFEKPPDIAAAPPATWRNCSGKNWRKRQRYSPRYISHINPFPCTNDSYEQLFSDGVHPSGVAYELWAQEVVRLVERTSVSGGVI